MKTLYKILFCSFLFVSLKISAQLDTLNYMKQFEANKAQYINQPFSKLLNNMTQIQPTSVWSIDSHNNQNLINKTRFMFCDMDESFSTNVNLTITWQSPLASSETEYYDVKNDFFFTNDERNYYGSKIVKDIRVYK